MLRGRSPRRLHLSPLFLAMLLLLAPIIPWSAHASQQQCESLAIVVYDDGGAWIYQNITVENAPANMTVNLLAPPLTLYAEDQEGVPLPVTYTNTTATVSVYGTGTVTVRYYTLALTSKTGYSWKISFTSPCPTILVLPGDAVPVRVEPTPTPVLYKGQAALRFPPGSQVQVEYYIIPGGAPQTSATAGQQPGPGNTATSPSGGVGGGTPGGGSNKGGNAVWVIAAIIVLLVAVAAGFSYLRSQRRLGGGGAASAALGVEASAGRLDERDRSILEALRERPMTAVELQQATGIPKTPLYRRLKKLLEEGLIEYYEENGVRVYKLRGQ